MPNAVKKFVIGETSYITHGNVHKYIFASPSLDCISNNYIIENKNGISKVIKQT